MWGGCKRDLDDRVLKPKHVETISSLRRHTWGGGGGRGETKIEVGPMKQRS